VPTYHKMSYARYGIGTGRRRQPRPPEENGKTVWRTATNATRSLRRNVFSPVENGRPQNAAAECARVQITVVAKKEMKRGRGYTVCFKPFPNLRILYKGNCRLLPFSKPAPVHMSSSKRRKNHEKRSSREIGPYVELQHTQNDVI